MRTKKEQKKTTLILFQDRSTSLITRTKRKKVNKKEVLERTKAYNRADVGEVSMELLSIANNN